MKNKLYPALVYDEINKRYYVYTTFNERLGFFKDDESARRFLRDSKESINTSMNRFVRLIKEIPELILEEEDE